MNVLDLNYNFASLSVRDLLEARDTYHYHLMSKVNVVGTAIGLYLIRHDEDWPTRKGEAKSPYNKKTYPRTLSNSEVRDYSWPCILAFVSSWQSEEEFGTNGRYQPAQIVPKTLYLADGRAVPVCVVQVDQVPNSEEGTVAAFNGPIPSYKLGGGSPIQVNVQDVDRLATVGCLVTDGHLTYALTARHACGEVGTLVSSKLRGGSVVVGESSGKQLTRMLFSEVYPDFPGRRSFVALDVGLVKLKSLDDWTSNTYSFPPVGPLADVYEQNLSLRLIDQPVVGRGAASGLLHGAIKALFYRYRSVGGFDYVGDFLISPTKGNSTTPGDSGMVWHLDVTTDPQNEQPKPFAQRDFRPLAVEWGGQVFNEGRTRSAFAVATSLSSVCKLLDVELSTDLSRGVAGYWGRTGHYSIAAFAISLVSDSRLKAFLGANSDLISFDLDKIEESGFDKSVGQLGDSFVPLADVPDEIWKKLDHGKNGREGGRDVSAGKTGSDGPEHPNHYADIDAKIGPHEETFRAMCLADGANLTVQAWLKYYSDLAAKSEAEGDSAAAKQYRTKNKQGLLPFRLWQFFDAMVSFLQDKDPVGFLTAAGIAAHYMGDGSQPLHGSIYADGDPSRTVTRHHPVSGKDEEVPYAKGVHSAFETAMLSYKASELLPLVRKKLGKNGHGLSLCKNGNDVAKATIELMDQAARVLPPMTILDSFEKAGAGNNHTTLNAMWDDMSDETAELLALGARYLAMLWDSAWARGRGSDISAAELKERDPDEIRARYIERTFVQSLTLDQIESILV